MAFQDALAAEIEGAATDESPDDERAASEPARDGPQSPFSMEYDLESFTVDSQTATQMIGGLVAITNLL
jgi:hypothetical protein